MVVGVGGRVVGGGGGGGGGAGRVVGVGAGRVVGEPPPLGRVVGVGDGEPAGGLVLGGVAPSSGGAVGLPFSSTYTVRWIVSTTTIVSGTGGGPSGKGAAGSTGTSTH